MVRSALKVMSEGEGKRMSRASRTRAIAAKTFF
jgi:hypothetical protein